MIRLIQRRLIVPRGDTGTFSIPVLAGKDTGDASVFTIFNPLTHRKIFEKVMQLSDGVLTMDLSHGDTVNLPVGQFVWDIKFYSNPTIADGHIVDGEEVDSYYAAFTLPVCEIRETGDNLLLSDEAPQATLSPGQVDYITASINEVTDSKNAAASSAAEADTSATNAENSASAAAVSEAAAQDSQEAALASQEAAQAAAQQAIASAAATEASAERIEADLETKANVADLATVATSGEYSDLLHTPTNVSSFTNDAGYLTQHQDISMKANSTDLATVATSGSYNDLENKPFIPSRVSDLTDDSGHYTKPVAGIPASDLEETYLTSFTETDPTVPSWAKAATKPTYTAAEVGAPTIQAMNDGLAEKVESIEVHLTMSNEQTVVSDTLLEDIEAAYEEGKIIYGTLTATENASIEMTFKTIGHVICWTLQGITMFGVTFSFDVNGQTALVVTGSENIRTGAEDWSLTSISNLKSVNGDSFNASGQQITNLAGPTTNTDAATKMYVDNAIPTSVSQLTNDSGYITGYTETDPTVPSWAKAINKPTYTASEVGAPTVSEMNTAIASAIGNVHQFNVQVVQALPTQDIQEHTVYFVPKTGDTNDVYDEYIYVNNAWEMIGNTQIDLSNYVQKTDYATKNNYGLVILGNGLTFDTNNKLITDRASTSEIKAGQGEYKPIVPNVQKHSVFYGLAQAAGDSTQSVSTNAVGTYTAEAKAAIRSMIGAAASADLTVQDVQVNGSSVVSNGTATLPLATTSNYGLVQIGNGLGINSTSGKLQTNSASTGNVKLGSDSYAPIVPSSQHYAAFYGLAKAAGADEKNSELAVGTYSATAKAAILNMFGLVLATDTEIQNIISGGAGA